MPFPRAAGLLLHPTSLPGRFGIGDLGPAAHAWLEQLARAGQTLWQVLPLGPTGYGDSPYQAFSAFAGNPLLVSLERLVEDGLLERDDLEASPDPAPHRVDFGAVIPWKRARLDRANERLRAHRDHPLQGELAAFRERHAGWLPDYTLFMALKEAHEGAPWNTWEPELVQRRPEALLRARVRLAAAVAAQEFRQFVFFRQWGELRARAHALGIRIVGDIPIFVAYDSADVWQHRELFHLDEAGNPTVVAGVPPDYFSTTGQRWGNPLYRWDVLEARGYDWWIDRLRATLAEVDIARIDHFRGFEACWAIPAENETAVEGRWVEGPRDAFFAAVERALGGLPLIAEDLGLVTPEVIALRDRLGLPGMKVLHFAFGGGPDDPFQPHNYERNTVVYTGTHDNDTTRGWYERSSTAAEQDLVRRYLGVDGHDIAWDLIRAAFASVADSAIVPLQDVLALGAGARMNLPGRPDGNWTWRLRAGELTDAHLDRLGALTSLYGRAPKDAQARDT